MKKRRLSWISRLSLIVVVLSTIAALFCYVIVPDSSSNANLQNPQVALLSPFSTQAFYQEKILESREESLFHQLIHGHTSIYKYHPYDNITIADDHAEVTYGKATRIIPHTSDNQKISKLFILGTDRYGRDVLSRLVIGLRVSLLVGLFAVILSVILGVFFGVVSGYFGGWVDRVIMMIINVNWSIPTLLLAFAILLVMERGLTAIYLAVGFTLWVELARILRGQVKELRNKDFVTAARTMGIPSWQIMWRHILPNLYGTILVMASINFATAILVEAGLSYLGLGVQPPVPSLGNMLKENYGYATSGHLAIALAPALTVLILVLSFNLLGNGLKEYLED